MNAPEKSIGEGLSEFVKDIYTTFEAFLNGEAENFVVDYLKLFWKSLKTSFSPSKDVQVPDLVNTVIGNGMLSRQIETLHLEVAKLTSLIEALEQSFFTNGNILEEKMISEDMKKELIKAIDDEEIQKLYEKTEKWENM